MTLRRLTTLLPALLTLISCAPPYAGTGWSVVDVYAAPELPPLHPEGATLAFGERTLVGSTGCAPLQGAAVFNEDDSRLTISDVRSEEPGDGCVGEARFSHERLIEVLRGDFSVTRLSPEEMVLTSLSSDATLDPPALRLIAL